MQRVWRRDHCSHGIKTPHRWAAVLLYVAAIYLTLPYAPRLWREAGAWTGGAFDSLAFYPLVTAGGMVVIAAIYRSGADVRTLLGLAALGSIYVYLYGHVFQAPAEKLHLLEYGLLSWILWWACQPNGKVGVVVQPNLLETTRSPVTALNTSCLATSPSEITAPCGTPS